MGLFTKRQTTECGKRVTVVGGGFSGTLSAIHLLRQAPAGSEIQVIEKHPSHFCGGIAYCHETAAEEYLTNIPIERMSAFADRPWDLQDWLDLTPRTDWPERYKDRAFAPTDPVPRVLFQRYLHDHLEQAIAARPDVKFLHITAEVVAIADAENPEDPAHVTLKDGRVYQTNQVVLATGFSEPKQAPFVKKCQDSDRYLPDLYQGSCHERRKQIPGYAFVMVIGTALSAYDAVSCPPIIGPTNKLVFGSI